MPPPDADLHPVATGLAKKTVDEHSAEQPLKLFAGWFCPFVQRAWIVLEEKKIPYHYVEVNPYHKPASLLTSNPRGLVPTLEVGPGRSLYESNVLCEYLEERFASHEPRLLPLPAASPSPNEADYYQRARARIWIDYVTSRIIPAFHRLLQFQVADYAGDGEARLEGLRGEFRGCLLEFTRAMKKGDGDGDGDGDGPWFMGGEFGMVDVAVLPWAARLWVFDTFKGGLGIPEPGQGGDDEKTWARFRAWLEAVESRESVKRTTSEREFYVPIYRKYADDVAQSELAKATRAGRGVP
ncbi:thioredoxin-like protein [Xylariomycetidae sp. FL2044]|nr:thioredoxin-like protein [Xylariomycetidae sp. FL2044]